jgi:formyl-CoA transferase
VQSADREGRQLLVPGIVPKLMDTPGRLRSPAPRLGEHTAEVLAAEGWARPAD